MEHDRGTGAMSKAEDAATVMVTLRVSPEEWVAMRELAEKHGYRLSVFIRHAINQAASCRILDDRTAR